jgi:hypothetical protein
VITILTLFFACSGSADVVVRSGALPFPDAGDVVDGHLALSPEDFEIPYDGTPVDTEHVAWRTGFSRVQTTVFQFDLALDPASLPGLADGDQAGSVQIWDLTDGVRLPCFAETDLYPNNNEVPTLLVRPLAVMPLGHRIAVAVTTDVRTLDGQSLVPVDWWAAAVAGEPTQGFDADHVRELAQNLTDLGLGELAVAVDYPIGDGTQTTRHLLETAALPTEWIFDRTWTAGLPEGAWQTLEGSFTVDTWLVDDVSFALDSEGLPIAQGTEEADLYVYFPESIRDAEPGTVPVWIFGHGIFSHPENYLGAEEDPSRVADLANRAGAIVVGTAWRGLTQRDILTPVVVGGDFGRLPELTDKLAQGVSNTVALARLLVEGDLLDDPLFEGLPARDGLRYYGISLGGIQGAVLMASTDLIDHAVLHVGGSSWSTLLERSSQWTAFEPLLVDGVASAAARQKLYAASQLYWDQADPANYVEGLQGRSILWQVSMGDEQVPNLTSELLIRSVGGTLLEPNASEPFGIARSDQVGVPAMVQFDPQVASPEPGNRPAAVTGAHSNPRLWDGTTAQTLRFLDADDPGVVIHACGEEVCSESNPGSL